MPKHPKDGLQATDATDDSPPEWVHLVPAGTFHGVDGRGPYRLHDPDAVIKASLAGGKLPIDENHATDLAAPSGGPSPARGWIVAMEPRPDGIWGRVDWTEAGAALWADRAYRGISPVLVNDKSGNVVRVLRAALTNAPNLPQLTTLHSIDASDLVAATQRRQLAVQFADTAILLRKIGSTSRENWITLHMLNPGRAEGMMAGIESPFDQITHAKGGTPATPATVHTLTPAQQSVCTTMGLDPAKFLAALPPDHPTPGLSDTELMVCEKMGLSPRLFAAAKPGAAPPKNHGLSDAELMVCRTMGQSPSLFAQTRDAQAAERKRIMTGEPAPSAGGLSASETAVCNVMGLSGAAMAAERQRAEPDGLDLTEAERNVCRVMGISPQAMAAQKRNGGQGQPVIARHAAGLSPEAKIALTKAIDPAMAALMREYGFTLEEVNNTGITRADLISYKDAGLTRADIEECRRYHVSPRAMVNARKMANEAPLWKAPP